MTAATRVELPDALERAATALRDDADSIRPANGDPSQLLRLLDPAGAQRVLRWLLENEPDAGDQLASEWAEDPDCDPALLIGIDASGLSKQARKVLRRVHHRLRSRGIPVSAPATPAVVAKIAAADEVVDAAALAPLDPRGVRIVYVVEANPTGGARIFELILSEDRGVTAFEVYSASRGKARRFLREITSRGDRPAVEAPPDAARALIARMLAQQPPTRPPPRGFSEWRQRLTATPDGSETPGTLARRALAPLEGNATDHVCKLIRERELGPWVPDHPALHAAAAEISGQGKSEAGDPDGRPAREVEAVVDEAAAQIFDATAVARCVAQFEETAYVYWKRGREAEARACLAAADAFANDDEQRRVMARAMLDVILEPAKAALETGADAPGTVKA